MVDDSFDSHDTMEVDSHEPEPEHTPEPEQSCILVSSGSTKGKDSCIEAFALIPSFLNVCDMKAAPTSAIVKKELTRRLSKGKAKILLSSFDEKLIRAGPRTFRILTHNGKGNCIKK